MENQIKTPAVQNLEQDEAKNEAKLQANAAALRSAHNAVQIAIVRAAEDATAENMADLRAAKLEVDALEAVRKELDRRAGNITRELEKARATAQRQYDERELRADLTSHRAQKEEFFETREELREAFARLPDFCRELETLRLNTIRLTRRAGALDMLDAADVQAIAGDEHVLLWEARDTITGDLHYLQQFVGQILGAILQKQGDEATAHIVEMGLENMRAAFSTIPEQTEEEREAEAAALQAYYRGERTREATFAFQRENRRLEQEQAEKEAAAMPAASNGKPQHASLSHSQRLRKAA